MSTQTFRYHEQGFEIHGLRNACLEVAIVPELGAKVISLRNLATGREWMWLPPGGLRLFRNGLGDDFGTSTMIGWDECLPTIAPCSFKGRELPDHGEVWATPWQVDAEALQQGALKTSVRLPVSPFLFERTLRLKESALEIDYRLTNLGDQPEEFLWALHALLPVFERSEIVLTPEAAGYLADQPWLKTLDFQGAKPACAKVFAGPLTEGRTAVRDAATGETIRYEWDTAVNNTLGVWVTRGGWNGYHHMALEPTNGAPDPLAEAAAGQRCGKVAANSSVSWQVTLRFGMS